MLFSPVYTEPHPRRMAAHAASCASSVFSNPFHSYSLRTLASHFQTSVPSNSFAINRFRTLCKIPGIGYPPPSIFLNSPSIPSISRRASRFSSTAYKMLLPQLLCFGNDPFSWGVYTPHFHSSPFGNDRKGGQVPPLQGAEEFVKFVGGVEAGFEFAGGEALAKIAAAGSSEEWRGELASTWSGQSRFRDGATPRGRREIPRRPIVAGSLGTLRGGNCLRRLIGVYAMHIARIHGPHIVVVSLAGLDAEILVLSRRNQRGIEPRERPPNLRSAIHVVADHSRSAGSPFQSHRMGDWWRGWLNA
jgi:hypothetical protein